MLQYSNIPVQPLPKLFWSKYPFKVTISVKPKNKRQRVSHTRLYTLRDLTEFRLKEKVESYKVVVASASNSIVIFFEHMKEAQTFLDEIDTKDYAVREVVAPTCEKHLQLLNANIHVVTRPTLFHNKYHYRMLFGPTTLTDDENTEDWCKSMFGDDKDKYRLYLGASMVLYLKDDDAVLLAKLSIPNIKKIEQVKLLSSVAEA